MDPLALFSHGEFLCFDDDDPELLFYTHGEFPRAASVVISKVPAIAGQGSGGKRRRRVEPRVARINDEIEIVTALLMADSEDDWDEWF